MVTTKVPTLKWRRHSSIITHPKPEVASTNCRDPQPASKHRSDTQPANSRSFREAALCDSDRDVQITFMILILIRKII